MKKKLVQAFRKSNFPFNFYLDFKADGFFNVWRLTVALFLLKIQKNCWRSCAAVAVAPFVFAFSFVLKS